MQLALTGGTLTRLRLRLPPVVPPFSTRGYRLFSILWLAAFALAVVGPLAGLYDRYTAQANNSQLLLGSRAGFAVAPADATQVRFLVGPGDPAGVRPGDHIVAVYGLPLPPVMPGANSSTSPARASARSRRSSGASGAPRSTASTSRASSAGPIPRPTGCVPSLT